MRTFCCRSCPIKKVRLLQDAQLLPFLLWVRRGSIVRKAKLRTARPRAALLRPAPPLQIFPLFWYVVVCQEYVLRTQATVPGSALVTASGSGLQTLQDQLVFLDMRHDQNSRQFIA